ncbi:CHASE3 domain-containing protein [Mucilaginibacter phyllosphaerae]
MKNRIDRNLRVGYGFSIFILLIVGTISYLSLTSMLASNRAVSHSSEVMQKLENLLSVMKDAETGQRGYLLSGQVEFLQPYRGAYTEAQNLSRALTRLTADNSVQQQNMDEIARVLHTRLDVLQQMITKKDKGETISTIDLEAEKAAMDTLRSMVAKATSHEQFLLKQRTASLERYTTIAPVLILFALVLAITMTIYSFSKVTADIGEKERLRLEIEQHDEETQALNEELTAANEELSAINQELLTAQKELAGANSSLERRVQERTLALQETEQETQALNEELTAINEEMAATNEELLATNEELSESRQRLLATLDEVRAGEERSAKLAAIVASSDDAIISKDLDGIITSWNRGAEQIFGFTEAEIVGQPVLKLISEDRHYEEPIILGRLRNGEKIDHYETIRRKKDGTLIDVSLTISPIHDREGKVIGVSKIARDITEQKRDDQRKNDFIGMASHELKTPLTSLIALIQVLQIKLKGGQDDFVTNALAKAAQQGRKMTGLINGFLNVSRLESGKIVIEKQHFDLTDLVREMIGDISMTVSSHSFDFDPLSEVKVVADHDKIGAVISNLLSNAVKYSPKGKVVNVACERHEKEVIVSVKDAGIGIKPQDQDKLFDRYYRVTSEHTRHISGFGVGLYLSAEIIERHDGRIWVESEKGIGSTFYFALPLAD